MPDSCPSSNTLHRTFWRGCLALLLVWGFALKGQAVPGASEPVQKLSVAESVHWWAIGVQELAPSGPRLTLDANDGGELPAALHLPFALIVIASLLLAGWRYRFGFTPNLRPIPTRPAAPRAPPL